MNVLLLWMGMVGNAEAAAEVVVAVAVGRVETGDDVLCEAVVPQPAMATLIATMRQETRANLPIAAELIAAAAV